MATLSWLIFRGNNHSKKQQYSTDSPHNMQAHGESSVHYRQASGLHWHEREMYSCLITVALIWHRHVPTNNLMQLSGNRVCNNWLDQNKMQTLTSLQLALCSIHFISTVWPPPSFHKKSCFLTLHFSHNLVWITAFWSFNKLTISAVHEWSYRSLSEKRLSGIWANTKAMHWSKCCGGHVHVT